jgi:hypothetical protein
MAETVHSDLKSELAEVQGAIVEVMPEVMQEMGSLLGFDPRRIPKRFYRQHSRRMKAYFEAIEPMIAAEHAHAAAGREYVPTLDDLERMLGALLRLSGKRLPKGIGPMEWLEKAIQKWTVPVPARVRRDPDFIVAHGAISDFANRVIVELGPQFDSLFKEWNATPELQKLMAMMRGWSANAFDFPEPMPRRFTEGQLERVANTYRTLSAFWELRLRFLVWLARAINGKRSPAGDMVRVKLFTLLGEIDADTCLRPLTGYLDRNVRNALAHGRPDWDRAKNLCVFHDMSKTVEWTCAEFWNRTAKLLVTSPALAVLEQLVNARTFGLLVQFLKEAKADVQSSPFTGSP